MKRLWLSILLIFVLPVLAWALTPNQKPNLGDRINWGDPITKGLVGCWLMNEGSGNTVYDLSGSGNNGTVTGATWTGSTFGPCLSFDGSSKVGSRVRFPAITINVAYTVILWSSTADAAQRMMCQVAGSGDRFIVELASSVSENHQIRYGHWNGTSYNAVSKYVPDTTASEIKFIACVQYTDNTHALWVDMVPSDGTTAPNSPGATAGVFWLGTDSIGTPSFVGRQAACLVYNRALSQSEIHQIYLDPFRMFRQAGVERYVTSGEAPPAAPQVITVIMSTLPAWLIVGLAIGFTYTGRRAA